MRAIGEWTISGCNLVPTDSSFKKIEQIIQSGTGNITQPAIQHATGWLAPIEVDSKEKTIHFKSF